MKALEVIGGSEVAQDFQDYSIGHYEQHDEISRLFPKENWPVVLNFDHVQIYARNLTQTTGEKWACIPANRFGGKYHPAIKEPLAKFRATIKHGYMRILTPERLVIRTRFDADPIAFWTFTYKDRAYYIPFFIWDGPRYKILDTLPNLSRWQRMKLWLNQGMW